MRNRLIILQQQKKKKGGTITPPPDDNTYTLDQSYKTSAGVYDINGNLLRTLWSNTTQAAGTYGLDDITWDGLSDDGVDVTAIATTYKVIANNITDIWEGVIGNTSSTFTGSGVIRHYDYYRDMIFNGSYAYFCMNYTEAWGSITRHPIANMQSKSEIMPNQTVQQETQRIATDGTRIYMAGRKSFSETTSYIQGATFANLGNFSNYLTFAGATTTIFGTTFKATDITTDAASPKFTGLAVQVSGNWLVACREKINSVKVIHKINGTIDQSLTFQAPKHAKFDSSENLWLVHGSDEIIEKFTVNSSTGALTTTSFTINPNNVQAMAFNADSSILAVADIDINGDHIINAYNTTTGSLLWTLGRAENYAENPTVYNDKFLFASKYDDPYDYTFITFESNGDFWVGDRGNGRTMRFNSSRVHQETIQYVRAFYNAQADPNNPTRVWGDYKEYEVDYSVALEPSNANGGWTYVRNWSESSPSSGYGEFTTVRDPVTLSNGRTYCLIDTGSGNNTICELNNTTGLRSTGVTIPSDYPNTDLTADGKIYRINNTGTSGTQTLYVRSITGFDGSFNPTLGSETTFASFTISRNLRMNGAQSQLGEITSDGKYVFFNGAQQSGWHLGAIKSGQTSLTFKASPSITPTGGSAFPANGEYDTRTGVEYGGNIARALDNLVIWGYNGEFWENGQTNRYNIFHSSGLFLHQFGEDTKTVAIGTAAAGMAGNAFSWQLVKVDGIYYVWTCDESYHGGVHKWKLDTSSIKEFNIKL